ncbi:hypothetical protein ACFO4E_08555 [Nocardiopsis mangrovi]|uniref:Uncharacterized protein n=1 Tax=Nocardiopsis mangrovi TaxID=1179818 RepID=A0ABV9DVK5_9ACTN
MAAESVTLATLVGLRDAPDPVPPPDDGNGSVVGLPPELAALVDVHGDGCPAACLAGMLELHEFPGNLPVAASVARRAGYVMLLAVDGVPIAATVPMSRFPGLGLDPDAWPRRPHLYSEDHGELLMELTRAGDTVVLVDRRRCRGCPAALLAEALAADSTGLDRRWAR